MALESTLCFFCHILKKSGQETKFSTMLECSVNPTYIVFA